jgi:cell fate regulator YaaT (PSP1 superfamily)
MEKKAFDLCSEQIKKLQLPMNLVKVERFFSGGKIIFYFTAENRVDFRELVKSLVQEFRTRVEMRQIGVRHETKMLGGLGCCGRELCCSSFIQNFESVSIKMAKEQNLPLNPAKISGACNRLLCCLNYEFKTYKSIRKNMPKIGKKITVNDQQYRVRRHNVLQESILATDEDEKEITLTKEEWQAALDAAAVKEK